jgi:hypothetical protein
MTAVHTLAELPFAERAAWDLLGLDPNRSEVNEDHDTAGWCRLPALLLEDAAGGVQQVRDVLVLGLHSRDDAEPLAGDVELEFVLREGPESYSAVVLLSEFLRARLAGLIDDASARAPVAAVVLALCNPQAAELPRPAGLGERPVFYAHGDVTAWMQRQPGARGWSPDAVEIILAAQHWFKL